MIYRDYLRELLFSSDAKKMANPLLFGTSYDLFTEYQSEAASARLFARRLMSFEAQSEIEFYIFLDYLTFIPFGEAGRCTLAAKGVDVPALKLGRAMQILESAGIAQSAGEQARLKAFFEAYGNDVQPITPEGYAAIARRISDKMINMIFCGQVAGSLGKARLFTTTLRQLIQEVYDKEETVIDARDTLSRLPDLHALDEAQINHLEDALTALG